MGMCQAAPWQAGKLLAITEFGEYIVSNQDPIADMLTRIRNGQQAHKLHVSVPSSKQKVAIVAVLKEEGFINDYQVVENGVKSELVIALKYFEGQPVIRVIRRISKPSVRIYKPSKSLTKVKGFGMAVLSTSKGVISDRVARKLGVGGELLCEVA